MRATVALLATLVAPVFGKTSIHLMESTCAACTGMSTSECASAINGALNVLDDSSKLAVLEHMFAGDICDDLSTTQCLTTLTQLLDDMPVNSRVAVLNDACNNDLLLEYSAATVDVAANEEKAAEEHIDTANKKGVSSVTGMPTSTDSAKPQRTCSVCTGMTDEMCGAMLDQVIMDAVDGTAYGVLRMLFGQSQVEAQCANQNEAMCADTLRTLLFEVSQSSRNAVYQNACDKDQKLFQHMELVAAGDSPTLSVDCAACKDVTSDAECLSLQDSNLRALDDAARLSQLEMMFPGDACEDKSDFECLNVLQGVYMSLSDGDRLTALCDTSSGFGEAVLESECSQCEGLDTSACVTLLNGELAALSDKSRLSFLRANVPEAELTCDGLKEKDCLSQLDSYMQAASDGALLSVYTSDCDLLATTSVMSKPAFGNDNMLEAVSSCPQCDDLDSAACLALLNDELSELSDKNRLSYLRTNVPEASSLCLGQSDKACLSLLDSYMEDAPEDNQLSVFTSDCDTLAATSTPSLHKAIKGTSKQKFVVEQGVTAKDNAGAMSLLAVVAAAVAIIVLGVKGAQAVRRHGYEKVAMSDPDQDAGSV